MHEDGLGSSQDGSAGGLMTKFAVPNPWPRSCDLFYFSTYITTLIFQRVSLHELRHQRLLDSVMSSTVSQANSRPSIASRAMQVRTTACFWVWGRHGDES